MRDDDVLKGEEDTVALDVLGCAARCMQRSKLSMSKFWVSLWENARQTKQMAVQGCTVGTRTMNTPGIMANGRLEKIRTDNKASNTVVSKKEH